MKVTGKEIIIENNDRKRKKVSEPKLTKEDVYANAINFEENESKVRSAQSDSTLFHQTSEELRKVFDAVAKIKSKPTTEHHKSEIAEKRIEGSMLFVMMKKLNRLDKIRFRDCREALQKEKVRVDSNRLQLQNLLYEADHLHKEIQRCYQFKSQDEEINLVPIETFYETAPASISRPDKTKTDEHAKRLARLEWELQQRKELARIYNEMLGEKEKITQDINKTTEKIDSLAPRLHSLLKATRPLQETLELSIEDEWDIHKISKFLPRPLYLLYVNLHAYISAINGKYLKVAIEGDEDEAKQVDSTKDDLAEIVEDTAHDGSDGEDNENEYEGTSKGHHRRLSKAAILELKIQNLYKVHPLTITLTMVNKENVSNLFVIKFSYLSSVGIITVQPSFVGYSFSGCSGDILNPNTILDSLIDADNGVQSPNPKTRYQLADLKIDQKTFNAVLEEKKYGKPYIWAQSLCGLEFISDQITSNTNLCVATLTNAVKLIRMRLESRIELQKQIKAFEENSSDFIASMKKTHAVRISSHLTKCTTITMADYLLHHGTKIDDLDDSNTHCNHVSENDLFYCVVLTRGSAKLECYINVPCNFPKKLAIWNLNLNWNGVHNAKNTAAIRDMEHWINAVVRDVKSSCKILEKQMERALTSLDIFLETEGGTVGTTNAAPEFIQDKTFIKAFRGRQRSRPYKLVDREGSGVFTQI